MQCTSTERERQREIGRLIDTVNKVMRSTTCRKTGGIVGSSDDCACRFYPQIEDSSTIRFRVS